MASDSNMNFHQGIIPSSFYNGHVVSFGSGAVNSTAGMVPGVMDGSGVIGRTGGMILTGNPGMMSSSTSAMIPARTSSGNLLLNPIPSLKHDTGLAVDWSYEEQAVLREGLIKYANEPNIMKYVKIAALLRDKTVRDVALRCQWMTKKESGKRRKAEECYAGKKIKDRKEKIADSSLKATTHPVPPDNMTAYPLMMHHLNQHDIFLHEALDRATQHRLEENAQFLSQIAANFATFKLQDNIDLFSRTRSNITNILNSMSKMSGIMSQMPLLPVSVNENLINIVLPGTSQDQIVHGKEEHSYENHNASTRDISFGTSPLDPWGRSFETRAKMLRTYHELRDIRSV